MDFSRPITVKQLGALGLAVLCLAMARPARPWLLAGIPLALLGVAIRIWGTGHLRKNQRLVTSGPYAYLRDPLYLGTLLISTGVCLSARAWPILAVVWLLFFAYYMPYKRRREGERLTRLFGESYAGYSAEVRSLIPRLKPYPGANAQCRWSARLVYENSEVGVIVNLALFYILLMVKVWKFPDWVWPKLP